MATALEQVCLPQPQRCVLHGVESAQQATVVQWQGEPCKRVAAYAQRWLAGFSMGEIRFAIAMPNERAPELDMDESYSITRVDGLLEVSAATTWGGLRAVATLFQLASGRRLVDEIEIQDHPRFTWRGVLIDVARHFMPLSLLRRVIDGMALLKLNVLHLHLSDDQGFRFASARYPKLASDEHYTLDELRGLVDYAIAAGVRVVPELDMPGHVTSWLVAYPEWGYQQVPASDRFGVHKACLDVSNTAVLQAIDELLDELVEVFPDRFIHIGGDEVHPSWWREDQKMQAFASASGLSGPEEIQNHFNRRLVASVIAKGRQVVGWDEVLHPEMPPLVVQNWRGATTRDKTLNKGLDCVVSAPFYLDLHYPAEMHYGYDPESSQEAWYAMEDEHQADLRLRHVAAGIGWTHQWRAAAETLLSDAAERGGRVLGGEACLWSELVDLNTLEVRLWSRLPAVAERLWSSADTTDVAFFYQRFEPLLCNAPFRVPEMEANQLAALGLSGPQIDLVKLLEPVKWYGRLLGETALRARIEGKEMPQARPYGVRTPLNRVVDFISPESLSARALRAGSWAQWQAHAHLWVEIELANFPEDTRAALGALQRVGAMILKSSPERGLNEAELLALYGPHDGEYMLAVIPSLLAWVDGQGGLMSPNH